MLRLSGTVGATTLSESQIAEHKHTVDITTNYWIADGAGQHYYIAMPNGSLLTASTGGSQSHKHSFSGVSTSSNSNLVPYYALSYIIRIM